VRKTKLSPLRIGTAGWSVPGQYADDFNTEGRHLERYAGRLNCAEINSSFYRSHRRGVYERWAAATPPDFRFAVKLPKTMTHEKGLAGCGSLVGRFAEEVGGLGEKLAVVLIQLPPSAPMRKRVVDAFIRRMRGALGADLAIEPRHPGWFTPENDLWLAERHIARVAADPIPKRVPVESGAARPGGWDGLAYYRWHGSPRVYYSNYPEEQLNRLRRRATGERRAGRSVWCIFDNTAGGHALGNALWLTGASAEAR
jgi:uncharacterized protein YecE (DUF72 family)